MELSGPEVYQLVYRGDRAEIHRPDKQPLGPIALSGGHQIYAVIIEGRVAYVGRTATRILTRLNQKPRRHYKGHGFRGYTGVASILIWHHTDGTSKHDVETVEAEVVFRIRQSGYWPTHQTEIHFHPPFPAHVIAADRIFSDLMAHC